MGLFTRKKNSDQFAIPTPPTLQAPPPQDPRLNTDFSPWDKKLTISKDAIDQLGIQPPSKSTTLNYNRPWTIQKQNTSNPEMPNTVFEGKTPETFDAIAVSPVKIPLPPNLEPSQIVQNETPKPIVKKAPLPVLDMHEPEKKPSMSSIKSANEEFSLPDFDDEELQKLEELERQAYEQAQDKLYASQKQETNWDSDPDEPITDETSAEKILKEEIGFDEETEVESKPIENNLEISKPILAINEPKFVALRDFFDLREGLTQARLSSRNAEEEMFEQTYKRKSELYKSAFSTFSSIQDKLMTIDAKLFDSETIPEVKQ